MIWTLPEAFERLSKAWQYTPAEAEPGEQKQAWIPGVYGHPLPIQAAAGHLELQRPFEPSAPSTSKKLRLSNSKLYYSWKFPLTYPMFVQMWEKR